MEEQFKCFMSVTKSPSGKFVGILSDTSMDRDKEFMSKELIQKWSKINSIKALANHENKMQSWVGGWNNMSTINKGSHTALVAEPWFFSKEANPLAAQIQKQVEEALERGENPGISIGAIPFKSVNKEINGEFHKVYEDAELVEATWVPVQSNRNATFGHIAKNFDYEITKPQKVEDCVDALMADPDFKQQDGKTKEESAWAVCQSKFGKECPSCNISLEKPIEEVQKMSEEKTPVIEKQAETQNEIKKEIVTEKPVFEVKTEVVEVQKSIDNSAEMIKENLELKEKLEKTQKELEEIKNHAILKAKIDGPIIKEVMIDDGEITIEKMLKMRIQKQ